ncbi:tetratricopeptide repeat protein [Micromonosporaceae bacterium B7E4]
MASGFGELTQQANALVAAGDLAGARNLLGPPLDAADPSPGHASAELAEAAGLQARVLVALGDPHAARGWAAFAYSATTRLYGTADQRTVATAATLAAVLHRVGSHARAARLYRDVIIELTANDGPESLRVLAAHADLATVEYAQGECTLARNRLEDAWELHREVYGDGHPGGIRMLARLGAMQRDCGLFSRAHEHLALARELCREHLPADHPLAAQVAALARAAADPDHVCADSGPESEDDPHAPSGRTGAPDYAVPWHPEPRHAEPAPYVEHSEHAGYGQHAHRPQHGGYPQHGAPQHAAPSYPAVPPPPAAAPAQPAGPASPPLGAVSPYPAAPGQRPGQHDQPYPDGPAGFPDGGEHPPDAELPPRDELPPLRFPPPPPSRPAGAGTDTPQVPPPRLPPAPLVEPPPRWGTPPPAGPPVPPPRNAANRSGPGFATGAGPTGDADDDPEHGWWPPDVTRRTPDGDDEPEAGRHPTPAAAEPWRPESRSGSTPVAERPHPELPDSHAVGLGDTGGVPEARHLPERRSSRLPVRIHRPPPAGRRLSTAVVAGLVVLVLLGTAAVVLGFGLTGDDEPESPAPGPATSAPAAPPSTPPPASPGTPPGAVTLADNGSSVTLGWSYPNGAKGPVVLAGGRAGQELRPFQELPAGSTGYVVYGLQTQGNYCFSVAVVYSESVVGEADPVCTDRPGRSPSAR